MRLLGKTLDELSLEDLHKLVELKVQERVDLDYKRKTYGKNDRDIKEMLKDISAMANARGGFLILGIEEGDDQTPEAIVGIENAEIERDRIINSCLANIRPPIPGLRGKVIPLGDHEGRAMLVIQIPRSTMAPHMVVFKGLNQFWIRHDRHKSPMSVWEIRESVLRTEEYLMKAEEFLMRRQETIEQELEKDNTWLVLSSLPIFVIEDKVDFSNSTIKEFLDKEYIFIKDWVPANVRPIYPTLFGIEGCKSERCFRVFHNGYIELIQLVERRLVEGELSDLLPKGYILGSEICRYVYTFVSFIKQFNEIADIKEPIIITLALFNVKDIWLLPRGTSLYSSSTLLKMRFDSGEWRLWAEEILTYSTKCDEIDIQQVCKILCDRLYNAFGFWECKLMEDILKDVL